MNLKIIILALVISINLSFISVINAMSVEEILKNFNTTMKELDKEEAAEKEERINQIMRFKESERKWQETIAVQSAELHKNQERIKALEKEMGIKDGKWAHPVQKQQEQSDCCIIS